MCVCVENRDWKAESSNPAFSRWLLSKCRMHSRTIVFCQRDKQGKCISNIWLFLSQQRGEKETDKSLMNANLTLFSWRPTFTNGADYLLQPVCVWEIRKGLEFWQVPEASFQAEPQRTQMINECLLTVMDAAWSWLWRVGMASSTGPLRAPQQCAAHLLPIEAAWAPEDVPEADFIGLVMATHHRI